MLAAAEQLNYKVDKNASGLRRQHSHTLALLFFEERPADGALINPFYLSMLGPMVRRCAEHGYDLLISFQQLSSDWHVDYEDSRKADGIILLGYGDYLEYRPQLEQLVERGTHFVRWGSAATASSAPRSRRTMSRAGSTRPTHLLQQGRRRIAFIGTAEPGYPEFHERWRGYCRALRAAGIEPDERLRVDADTERGGRPRRGRASCSSAASSSMRSSPPATSPRSARCTRCSTPAAASRKTSRSSASTTSRRRALPARR